MKVNYSFQKAARERAKAEKKEAKKREGAAQAAVPEEPPVRPDAPQDDAAVKA